LFFGGEGVLPRHATIAAWSMGALCFLYKKSLLSSVGISNAKETKGKLPAGDQF